MWWTGVRDDVGLAFLVAEEAVERRFQIVDAVLRVVDSFLDPACNVIGSTKI